MLIFIEFFKNHFIILRLFELLADCRNFFYIKFNTINNSVFPQNSFILKEVWKTMGSTKEKFLYNSTFMSLCCEFIKKFQEGHPEGNAS